MKDDFLEVETFVEVRFKRNFYQWAASAAPQEWGYTESMKKSDGAVIHSPKCCLQWHTNDRGGQLGSPNFVMRAT